MKRKKIGIAFMAVVTVGIIVSAIGSAIAVGLDQGGLIHSTFHNAVVLFGLLLIIGITVLYPDLFESKRDQVSIDQGMSID